MKITDWKREYDVVVIGGGTAGAFAAIAAAQTGAAVLLLEKNSMLGGTMTVCDVSVPGLFFAWGRQVIGGPCWEVLKKTAEHGGARLPEISFCPRHHWEEQIPFHKLIYLHFLNEQCRQSGVEILTNAMLSDLCLRNGLTELLVTCKEGLYRLRTKTCIDATGDANVVSMSGLRVVKSAIQQPATLINRISGYELRDVRPAEIEKAFSAADFPYYVTPELLFSWLERHIIDLHIPCENADTSLGKTQVNLRAVSDLFEVCRFYRKIKGLENLTVDFVSADTGIRESNRIVGEYEITADDYITGRFFVDSVCYAFYPIDLHVMDGIQQKYHAENVVAKVPYRALIPKGAQNILCAGRCISSDTLANSGLRVEAVCMATGQAAGCAAALAVKHKLPVAQVDYGELCTALRAIGGIVPEREESNRT